MLLTRFAHGTQDTSMSDFITNITVTKVRIKIDHAPIETVMTDKDKQRSGLTNLSSDNWAALNEWLDTNGGVGEGPIHEGPIPTPPKP